MISSFFIGVTIIWPAELSGRSEMICLCLKADASKSNGESDVAVYDSVNDAAELLPPSCGLDRPLPASACSIFLLFCSSFLGELIWIEMFLEVTLPSKSGRLTLVPPSEVDDVYVAALRCRPETRRYLRYLPEFFSVTDARDRRLSRELDSTLVDFHIHLPSTQADAPSSFIGTTGIFKIEEVNKSCEVGILISSDYFRGGFATEALHRVLLYVFEERNLHRAEFVTSADNLAMRGWLDKAGATLEGTKRGAWADPTTGGYDDACVYGILQEEWMASVKGRLEARINRTS
ncbi:Ribosomal-protein-alanine acetyltransferase [Mycena sanguinolenta]|uniref:Ribosomal-protein-alanine acetyltransferase n=1 Tax=Mycena sanguinolenta TaxID=230812 RepID=A0A8H6YCG4_9AGAR|nr:Ribosomal-protein-alanine acetyltransferase [Mycena sanguinolenta]